jgi:hypothetical protein
MLLLYYIVKHFFHIPQIVVAWQLTISQTKSFATGKNINLYHYSQKKNL